VRTERWRPVTLPVALAWVGFASWAAWGNFTEVPAANIGLVITSTYLLLAGVAQQVTAQKNSESG
jgi:phosphatidylcholine synthase